MESSTQKMLGIVALVYAIPVALFLIGYLAAFALGGSVGVQYGTAIAGFVLGILFLRLRLILFARKMLMS